MQSSWSEKIYTPHGFVRADVLGGAKALDVGCGNRKLPGAVGMDILELPAVDVKHDFNRTPWPFSDGSFDLVFMNHALEHAFDVGSVMEEAHRVLSSGGRLVVQVPYFRSVDAFTDPTHRHFFTAGSFDYFIEDTALSRYGYNRARFRKRGFWYGWPQPSKNPLTRLFKAYISAHPVAYDQYLSLAVPMDCLTWELEPVK